jgi:hypothetical protein
MAKRATFFSSVSSVKGYVRVQTSLMTMLGLVLGMFIYTSPAYAQSPIVVKFKSLGQARSARVLFRGEQVDDCVTTSGSTITGNVDGNGMFSVNFYFTPDCSGTRAKFFRFSVPQESEGGTVTCQKSDAEFGVNCKLKLNNTAQSSPILTVQFDDLPVDTLSGGILNAGLLKGDCITKATTLQVPIDGKEFTLVFFKTSDCSGGSKRSRRFSLLDQQPEGSLTCRSNGILLFGVTPLN